MCEGILNLIWLLPPLLIYTSQPWLLTAASHNRSESINKTTRHQTALTTLSSGVTTGRPVMRYCTSISSAVDNMVVQQQQGSRFSTNVMP